jgi:hypothetical protein
MEERVQAFEYYDLQLHFHAAQLSKARPKNPKGGFFIPRNRK